MGGGGACQCKLWYMVCGSVTVYGVVYSSLVWCGMAIGRTGNMTAQNTEQHYTQDKIPKNECVWVCITLHITVCIAQLHAHYTCNGIYK